MFEDFVLLFTNMGLASMLLLIFGIIFMAVEMCIPGFGVFGVVGLIGLFGSIVARALEGANITQICVMIIICLVLVFIFFAVVSHSMQKGLLSKTGLVETGEAVKKGYKSKKEELVGKEGVTKSKCRPAGSVQIDGVIYDCVSEEKYIKANKKVKVVKIKDDNIVIDEVEES